jgi:predicted GNAT family acetyltransferase
VHRDERAGGRALTTTADARQGTLRRLGPDDAGALLELCGRDPVANAFVASQVLASDLDPWRLPGRLWGWEVGDRLVSACYSGGNLVPVETVPAAAPAFARQALDGGRRSASVVGPTDVVAALWTRLRPAWGPAREERWCQPLLALGAPARIAPDPQVRPALMADLDVLVPACEAMFTEEVGVPPYSAGGRAQYAAGIAELVRSGRSFLRRDRHGVVFKAEVGAVTPQVAQVQGVWVAPRLRGRGLAAPALAAVVALTRARLAPVVSLYVNDFNGPALAAYRRTGFEQVGTFATVLL